MSLKDDKFKLILQVVGTCDGFVLEQFDSRDTINKSVLATSTSKTLIEQRFMDAVSAVANSSFHVFDLADFMFTWNSKRASFHCSVDPLLTIQNKGA